MYINIYLQEAIAIKGVTYTYKDTHIQLCISAGPNGAHGRAGLLFNLLSLLARHHAIDCQISILLSRFTKTYDSCRGGHGEATYNIYTVMCGCVLVVSNECNLNMFTNGKDAIKFDAGLDNLKKAINEVNKLNEEELYIIKENAINVLESEFSTKVLNNKYKQFIK